MGDEQVAASREAEGNRARETLLGLPPPRSRLPGKPAGSRRSPLLADAARLNPRLPRADATPLQDDGVVATLLQRERDRDAGDAAAHDDDVRHDAASAAAAAAFRRTTSSVFSSSTVGVNSTASLSSRNEMRWPGST